VLLYEFKIENIFIRERVLLEVDGEQHFENSWRPKYLQQNRDIKYTHIAVNNNFKLIRISYNNVENSKNH